MTDVFLSYSREDQATARRFAETLQREGLSVWWDQALNPGEAFDQVTEQALDDAGAVVVLWSKASVASRWVRAEATQANASNRLVPVMIEPCRRPIMFELTHTVDLAGWKGDAGDPAWRGFVAGVRRLVGGEAAGGSDAAALRNAAPPALQSAEARKTRPLAIAIVVAAALLLGGGIWWLAGRDGSGAKARATSAAVPAAPVTLAVLPFRMLSEDADQSPWSTGMAEDIAVQLNQVRALRVIGSESSRRFRDSDEDPREIGRKLGAAHLLTGSVRKDDRELLLNVQLIDTRDGTQTWSNSYRRELRDVFALQQQIARDVAAAVGIVLDVSALPRAQGGTNSVAAWEAYQRFRSDYTLTGSMLKGVPHLREAVALDPEYKQAWFMLYVTLREQIQTETSRPALAELRQEMGRAAAQLASLPPDSALALTFRAWQLWQAHRWAEALQAAEAAAAASPNDMGAVYTSALILTSMGRMQDSIAWLRRAAVLEPLDVEPNLPLIASLRDMGRETEATAELQRYREAGGVVPAAFEMLMKQRAPSMSLRDVAEAAGWAISDGRIQNGPLRDERATILTDPAAASTAARRHFQTRVLPGAELPTRSYLWLANATGDLDLLFAVAQPVLVKTPEQVLGIMDFWGNLESSGSESRPIRSDPRFKALMRDMGLADYWRSSGNWGDFCKPVGDTDFECH